MLCPEYNSFCFQGFAYSVWISFYVEMVHWQNELSWSIITPIIFPSNRYYLITIQNLQRWEESACSNVKLSILVNYNFFTHEKVLMSAVSCRPVRRRSLPSPYAAMCSLCLSPSFPIAFLMISKPPSFLMDFVLKSYRKTNMRERESLNNF